MSMEKMEHPDPNGSNGNGKKKASIVSGKLLHEVFLNTGLYLLFGGILIGYISGMQGEKVTREDDHFFVSLFQGVLCLFLLEMGMTASRKLKDLKTGGWPYVAFALVGTERIRDRRDPGHARLRLSHGHAFPVGVVRALRRSLRRGLVHRRPGGPATCDSRGEPDAAAGGVAGPDVFV